MTEIKKVVLKVCNEMKTSETKDIKDWCSEFRRKVFKAIYEHNQTVSAQMKFETTSLLETTVCTAAAFWIEKNDQTKELVLQSEICTKTFMNPDKGDE